jgi:hypothetical protein
MPLKYVLKYKKNDAKAHRFYAEFVDFIGWQLFTKLMLRMTLIELLITKRCRMVKKKIFRIL